MYSDHKAPTGTTSASIHILYINSSDGAELFSDYFTTHAKAYATASAAGGYLNSSKGETFTIITTTQFNSPEHASQIQTALKSVDRVYTIVELFDNTLSNHTDTIV